MRPLPQPLTGPLAAGPKRFVDASKGDDAQQGSETAPWKTLARALRDLQPGDTLSSIARHYDTSVAQLKRDNHSPETLRPGDKLVIRR